MTAWALVEKVLPDGSSEKWAWDGIALVARGNDIYVNEPHAAGGTPVLTKTDKGVRYHTSDMLGTMLWSSDMKGKLTDSYTDPLSAIEYFYGSSNSPNAPSWLKAAANMGGTPFHISGEWSWAYSGALKK